VLLAAAAAASLLPVGRVLAQIPPAAPPAFPAPQVPAPLEEPATPAGPVAPQYQVEVMIFAHRDFDRAEEQFAREAVPAAPLTPEPLRAPPVFDDTTFGPLAQGGSGLATGSGEPAALGQPPESLQQPGLADAPFGAEAAPGSEPLAEDPNEFRFRLLQPEELQLTAQYRIISRNPQAYVPLLHAGWVQPGLPEAEARPFDLSLLGVTNPVGSIRLYLSRFLHVDLDLSYLDAAAPRAAQAAAGQLAEIELAPRYRLVVDRAARSNELHYFDHPAFGVLVRVTPVRDPPPPAGTSGTRPAA
jgi:hypothetical protein